MRREGLVRRDYRREGLVRRDYRREGWCGGTTGGRCW